MTRVHFEKIGFLVFVGWATCVLPIHAQTSPDSASYAAVSSGDLRFSPSILSSRTYYEGSETIGRVGYEPILKRDILHQLKKMAHTTYLEQLEKIQTQFQESGEALPDDFEEQLALLRQNIRDEFLTNKEIYSSVLDNYIRGLLYYNDFVVSRPKEQLDEQKKHLAEIFENEQVPELLKKFQCRDRKELADFFEKELDSTLSEEKRIFVQETLGGSWLMFNLGNDDFHPSAVDLQRYYEAHRESYLVPDKVKWQVMSVSMSKHSNREEAYNQLVQMGNQVKAAPPDQQEERFSEVARAQSEDIFASAGGVRDWMERGVIASKTIEDLIFNEDFPVGQMSKIIEDRGAFYIVRVMDRELSHYQSFVEVQEDVQKSLMDDRRQALQEKYETALSKRYTIEIYEISQQEHREILEATQRPDQSATGRETILR